MQPHITAYRISTQKEEMNIAFIHQFLSNCYWAKGIPVDTVQKAVEGALPFGVFKGDEQVGFARVITDGATFAYLADVFIDDAHRGLGLSKMLMEAVMAHPQLQGLRRFVLVTRDAHGLYEQFGFTPINNPELWMQVHRPNVYEGPLSPKGALRPK